MTIADRLQGVDVLGTVFVIAKGGHVLYEYVSREAGDHPEDAELLRALDSASS